MRGVFFGTPEASLPSLEAMASTAEIVGVFTQPDRPRGRSKRPVPSPVKEAALEHGWPVHQPASREALSALLPGLAPVDVGVVVAYGLILDARALAVPAHGMLNVHFSRLPRWRGAAPVERAILAGDTETGVTIMVMDEGLDTGPIVASAEVSIGSNETAGALTERLAALGSELLRDTLSPWTEGQLEPMPQPATGVTYASKLTTQEARLDPAEPAVRLLAKIRAFNPRPGAHVSWQGQRVKLWEARLAEGRIPGSGPGNLQVNDDRLVMQTGTSPIELVVLQPAGKGPMVGMDWARGRISDLGSLE